MNPAGSPVAGDGSARAGRGVWIAAVLIVVAFAVVIVLSGRQTSARPFDVTSSAPDGYRAIAILLRERGAHLTTTSADRMRRHPPGPGDVLVIPVPDLLTIVEYRSARDAAGNGALVVLGSPRRSTSGPGEEGGVPMGWTGAVSSRSLADMAAEPRDPGRCDIARLDGLGPIDVLPAEPVEVGRSGEQRSCYGDDVTADVVEERVGDGSVITLGSPYRWSNARLQPAKEAGGQPLDNAALALRLLGPSADGATAGTSITFVDPVPTGGVAPDGTRSPLELLPTGVKLAVLQLVVAFVLYAWWRGRRLGSVVVERMPVQIAGSELVVAVGDLLRRRGTPQRAADVLRRDARSGLARRFGVPSDAAPNTLVEVVASRTGRDPGDLAAVLLDAPVDSAEALLRLAQALSDIRQEVLHPHV